MRDLYKILNELDKRKIHFCFQSHGDKAFYNLIVKDTEGKSKCFSSSQIEIIENTLKVLWGHLITGPAVIIPSPSLKPIGMPLP